MRTQIRTLVVAAALIVTASVLYAGAVHTINRATKRVLFDGGHTQGPEIRMWTVEVDEHSKYYFSAIAPGKDQSVYVYRCTPNAGDTAIPQDDVETDTTTGHDIGYPDNEDQFFYAIRRSKDGKHYNILQANEDNSNAQFIANGNGVKMEWNTPDGPVIGQLNKE
ncbi:MAG TPA: hypothetical protein VFW40_13795 [Capsulimonadaceae bacterium]|nr:hypothetical protein [Capsulimonadaceae bacterium]